MPKVLIVTYYWPPGSGAGVQRWLKFSGYLPDYGWEPLILTVDPEYAAYPAIDNTMSNEVPEDLIVYKTKARDFFKLYNVDKTKVPSAGFAIDYTKGLWSAVTRFIRGNLFIPDPRRGWNKAAFKKACEIIDEFKIYHIITTSPPHSTQLIGLKLKGKYPSIKWIADLRDPWTDIYYYDLFYPTFFSRSVDLRYEKSVIASADKIITVGKSLKDLFAAKVPGTGEKIEVISNGYDTRDFPKAKAGNPGLFTVSYIGTLSDIYPVNGFLEALSMFIEKNINFTLRFIGAVSSKQKALILEKIGLRNVEFMPYVDHHTSIRYLLDSTVLLLIIPDHKTNRSIITGKLFEYLFSFKPVICLGPPDGDAAQILEETGHGRTFHYDDTEGIKEFVEFLLTRPEIHEKTSVEVYARENLARKVASLLG